MNPASDGKAVNKPAGTASHDIAALIDIKSLIRDEVKSELDTEREVLKNAFSAARWIVGVSFGALLGLFTIFSFTTWASIKSETMSFVKQKADNLISQADSDSGIKATLNEEVNTSILYTSLIQIEHLRAENANKNSKEPKSNEIQLTSNAGRRLREWLSDPELSLSRFTDIVTVLNAESEVQKTIDARGIVSEMLYPQQYSKYAWIKNDHDKRLAILQSFSDKELGNAAVSVATDDDESEQLRIAAIRFLRLIKYSPGMRKLTQLLATNMPLALKFQCILACADISPFDETYLDEVRQLTDSAKSKEASLYAAGVLNEIWFKRVAADTYTTDKAKNDVALQKQIIVTALEGPNYLAPVDAPDQIDYHLRELFMLTNHSKLLPPNVDIALFVPKDDLSIQATGHHIEDNISSFVGYHLTYAAFASLTPYWKLLDEAIASQNIARLAVLLPRYPNSSNTFVSIYWASADLSGDQQLVVQEDTGTSVTLDAKTCQLIRLAGEKTYHDFQIKVEWILTDGKAGRGTLVKVTGKDFDFHAESTEDSHLP